MSWTYLDLANRVLRRLNEVQLTVSTFGTAVGFQATVLDSINDALNDIYDNELRWPFLWSNTTFTTSAYVNSYALPATYTEINWNSFFRQGNLTGNPPFYADVATVANGGGSNYNIGDTIILTGGTFSVATVLVVAAVSGTAVTSVNISASGNYTVVPTNPVSQGSTNGSGSGATFNVSYVGTPIVPEFMTYLTYDDWQQNHKATDSLIILGGSQGSAPDHVFPYADKLNLGVSMPPDTQYTIYYEYYYKPTDLVNYTDTIVIPDQFSKVVVDGATYYAYMFRDNVEEAQGMYTKFNQGIIQMRTRLINIQEYMRSDQVNQFTHGSVGYI